MFTMPAIALVIVAFLIAYPYDAFAYIDPGTGSFLIQILLGLVFGVSLGFKFIWRRVVNFFKSLSGAKKESNEKSGEEKKS